MINFNFEPKNHNFNNITATSEHNVNHLEAKLDPVVKEKKRVDPASENDPYFHTLMSLTRKIRPICDFSGLPCGTVWYARYPEGSEANPVVQGIDPTTAAPIVDQSELREYNRPGVVILSEEAFQTGKYPKCFDPNSFKRETLSERLQKANKNSRHFLLLEEPWTSEETEELLLAISELKEENLDPVLKKFAGRRSQEEIVFHYLSLPIHKITQAPVFGAKKSVKSMTISIDQREAINTLIAQDPNALDDFNNPILQHASIFKLYLDKVKSDRAKQQALDTSSFPHERDPAVDDVLGNLLACPDATPDETAQTVLELEAHLQNNAQELKSKSESSIRALLKVLIELQLNKLEQKVAYVDEYEKGVMHELKLVETIRNQIKVEKLKQEAETRHREPVASRSS